MEPQSLLSRLREKHGVSEAFSLRFLPLLERAVQTSPDIRRRILELVERSFVRQAERQPALEPAEIRVLDRVARILHAWEPAAWLKRWSHEQRPDAEST